MEKELQLRLPTTRKEISLTVGDKRVTVYRYGALKLRPWHNSYEVKLEQNVSMDMLWGSILFNGNIPIYPGRVSSSDFKHIVKASRMSECPYIFSVFGLKKCCRLTSTVAIVLPETCTFSLYIFENNNRITKQGQFQPVIYELMIDSTANFSSCSLVLSMSDSHWVKTVPTCLAYSPCNLCLKVVHKNNYVIDMGSPKHSVVSVTLLGFYNSLFFIMWILIMKCS